MIEFCTKKRMVFGILFLITISVIVLMIENRLPMGHDAKNSDSKQAENASKPCPEGSRVSPTQPGQPCRPCSDHDQKIYFEFCKPTGYREVIGCEDGSGQLTVINRSCPVEIGVQERSFWLFEGSTAVLGVLSYAAVYARQRRLDRLLIEKVHRQIASGV